MKELWTPKIFTLKGLTGENILGGVKALDIGCGLRKLPGSLGMDFIREKEVDIVHDLRSFPWPLQDDTFDLIFMNSVLEHVPDVLKTLEEVHRVGKDGARVVIKVPHFRALDAFADPTHYHFFASYSLDFVVEGTEFAHYHYSPVSFKKLGFWYGWPHPSKNPLKQLFKNFVHAHPIFYDKYLSLLFPVECVFWELEIVKK